MSRLTTWINELKNDGLSEYDIAAGLDNGDIERPEWLSSGNTAIGYTLWDSAESDGTHHLYNLDTDQQ